MSGARHASAWEAVAFVICLLLLSGCRAAPAAETDAAIDVVQRFFAALPGADCRTLGKLIVSDQPCAEVVAEYKAHEVELLEVESAVKDGRDADAILVRARLAQGGEPQRQIAVLRVVRHDGVWRLKP